MNNTITVHAQFSGVVADILDRIIESGRASNRTEAIRLALLEYEKNFRDEEDRLAVEKMQRIDKEIEEGKRKVLSKEEALGKYAHLLD